MFGIVPCRWVHAELGQRRNLLNQLVDLLAVRARVERAHHRLLDRVVVATELLAVLAQYVELVGKLPGVVGEEVAGVGVLGDEPQRLLLAAAADQDRRVRLAESAWGEFSVRSSW